MSETNLLCDFPSRIYMSEVMRFSFKDIYLEGQSVMSFPLRTSTGARAESPVMHV
jgi:hypothetical protein